MKKDSIFWVGYSDLLTSLFFIMLVLFVITFAILKNRNEELKATEDQVKEINRVQKALGSLDQNYYSFDSANNRYKLNIDVLFPSNSDDFNRLSVASRDSLRTAGWNLFGKIDKLIHENPEITYLLVIEGNAARSNNNWLRIPDEGYKLSYRRALSLVNYWKTECKIPFDSITENCELLIAGSGHFGQSRESNEQKNKRFTIQITSKVGNFLNKEKKR